MRPTGIAVIGAGPWGLTLMGAFASMPGVSLRWICELDDERRARAGAVHPGARLTNDVDAALRDRDVAAVVVAVDPARHHAVGMRALEAGKHLFVEKPLALSTRDAEEMCRVAAGRGLVLSVGHLLLHHPAIQRARQIVAAGVLGEPLRFSSRRLTPGAPRKPGSAWWALAPHDVSLALYLFNALPTVATTTGEARGAAQEDNAATAIFQFASGRTAAIHVERFAVSKRRETTITGTSGTLTFDELAAADQTLRLWTLQHGEVVVPVERRDALRAQCLDFVACVGRGDAGGGSGAHAVDVVRALEAGERSMRRQGTAAPAASASGAAIADATSSFEAA
jgi:predicted dehydrogenase